MDEPFGAVDPITRVRLQDELISIQAELQKTIVFVTHDFDEAVKLGDWIAIFNEGAQLVQYDTPDRILADPANEFVENFIGAGTGLKELTLTRVEQVKMGDAIVAKPGDVASDVLSRLTQAGHGHAVIVDQRRRPIQWLSRKQLSRIESIGSTLDPKLPVVGNRATLSDALDIMLVSSAGAVLVTGRRDVFQGVIDIKTVMDAIAKAHDLAGVESVDAPMGLNTAMIAETADAVGTDAQEAHAVGATTGSGAADPRAAVDTGDDR